MQTTVHQSFPPAESLMRRVLRDGAPIAGEYPLVFGEGFSGRMVTAEEETSVGSELRSACAILVRDLVIREVELRVGFIGSVVTHPDHRKKGWCRRLLERAEAELRDEGCAFSMLWAEDPRYYEPQGYRSVGTELNYLVDPCLSAVLPSLQRVRVGAPADFEALYHLYCEKPERVARTLDEMRTLLAIPEMELLVREDAAGEVVAYSCVGRGEDFASVIHEWAGSGEDVLATIQAHIQRRLESGDKDPLVIMVPAGQGLDAFFDSVGAPHITGVLGLAKLLDSSVLLPAIASLLPDTVEAELSPDASLVLSAPRGEIALPEDQLLTTFLEPKGARRQVEALEEALGLPLPILPLRPFVWGLDSI